MSPAITIDGAQMSGSGTIVRNAVALSALLGRPTRVINARARRTEPGLRPQHVTSVRACAELCGASVDGLQVGSQAFEFAPGRRIRGGDFEWDIGTAGSATMLALSILPVACFATAPVHARISGGVFQDFAPSPYHIAHVLAPLLGSMGAQIALQVTRPGYVPGGRGIVELTASPCQRHLRPIDLSAAGHVSTVDGVAMSSHLGARRVSERMASTCEAQLHAAGLSCRIDREDDASAVHPGACLAIWTESSTGARFGADRAGKFGRSSEDIGHFVAATLLEDVRSGATVDRHLADQLVVFCALAHGDSTYRVPHRTAHLDSNLWLVEQFGARASFEVNRVDIRGAGLTASPATRDRVGATADRQHGA